MTNQEKAIATQMANIETRTGKSIAELIAIVKASRFSKHGELVKMLKTDLGMGHGDANMVVHLALKSDGQSAAEGETISQVLDGLYTGPRRHCGQSTTSCWWRSGSSVTSKRRPRRPTSAIAARNSSP